MLLSVITARFLHRMFILPVLFKCQNLSMFIEKNPNPQNKRTDDCVVRAVAIALNIDWQSAYTMLSAHGLKMADLFSKNYVWADLLVSLGFKRTSIPDTCPACYTVKDFTRDHPKGLFVVGTGDHVLTVIDGNYYDSFDSGSMVPIIYFRR